MSSMRDLLNLITESLREEDEVADACDETQSDDEEVEEGYSPLLKSREDALERSREERRAKSYTAQKPAEKTDKKH